MSYYTISKTGATKGYQKLISVDADILQNPNYKTITDHTYYRQRITMHKQDEDGEGLGGIGLPYLQITWKGNKAGIRADERDSSLYFK